MFRHFSFDAAPSLPSALADAERAAMNSSPTSRLSIKTLPTRPPTPPPTVGDLTEAFDQQTLLIYPDEPLTPPSEDDSFPVQSYNVSTRRPGYSRIDSSILRMQRQAHVRMQCSTSHAKDVSRLVESMIETGAQCKVCEPKPRSASDASNSSGGTSPSSVEGEDEGVDMECEPYSTTLHSYALDFRRAGERSAGCAFVQKSIKMRTRKRSRVTKRSSR